MSKDSVADDLLRNGYDRWLRLEEEKAAISGDLKELFAELKGQGFAPKALRESFRRVRNIDDADQREHDDTVDLYVASLTRGTRAYTRGDGQNSEKPGPRHGGAAASDKPATAGALDVGAGHLTDLTGITEPATHAAAEGDAGGGEDAPVSCVDTNSPVTVEGSSSTGGADVGGDGGTQSRPLGIRLSTSLAGVEGDVDRQPIRLDDPADAVVGGTQPADDRRNSETLAGEIGESPIMAPRQATGNVDGSAGRSHSTVHPSTESPASVPVVAGGVHIPHHGVVRA